MKYVNGDWIEYGKTFKDFEEEGLSISGTQVEWLSTKLQLIGDINMNGGACDCCGSYKETVVRYRVLLSPEKKR